MSHSVVLYGIPNCDTVRKSRRWFVDQGIEHRFHDLRKDGLDSATLARWEHALGWEALLNRRGTTWRKLPEQTRSLIDRDTALALMLEQPSLIKRPVVEMGERLSVGYEPAQWAS